MIIQALVDYYDRLSMDHESSVPPLWYQNKEIQYEIVLSPNGYNLNSLANGDKSRGREICIPAESAWLTRTANLCSGFLCDTAEYVLGIPNKRNVDRAAIRHDAFVRKHLEAENLINDTSFSIVCRFLEDFDLEKLVKESTISDRDWCIFRVAGNTAGYVHDRAAVRDYWARLKPESLKETVTLLKGLREPVARLHGPPIRGVAIKPNDPLPKIVSFDKENDAWCSYGKKQGANSPIGIDDAFKYCTALNKLTTNADRRVRIGDMTIVFWADQPSKFDSEWLEILGQTHESEDQRTLKEIRNTLSALRRGRPIDSIDPDTPFYILGVAPSAARLSIKLWLASTIGAFAARLSTHLDDLDLEPMPEDCADLSIRRLIAETAPPKGGWADEGSVSPLLAGSVLRAILTGSPYPRALLSGVLNRVRTEGLADEETRKDWRQSQHRRCAVIKACLLRDARTRGYKKEIPVSLDPERPEIAYQLGRLFAALEKSQEDAMPGLNATIKDRYFGSASATPGVVFPRLCRLHQHHIEKLEGGLKVNREKLVQEIVGRLDAFPSHLSLDDQGLFTIGYYHQRQFFFTKKEDRPTTESTNA